MDKVLINTNFDFKKQYFDKYFEEFMPSDESFDFIKRQTLPQDFIDFVLESSNCIKETLKINEHINEDDNERTNKQFHLNVIELLMIFGLSFCTSDYLDYNTLKTHRQILENDLLITVNESNSKKNNKKRNLEREEEDYELEYNENENYFSERLEHTKGLLNNNFKSAIFLFNIDGAIKTYYVDNNYLNKAPIILVYSKTRGRILFPSDFRYYSRSLIAQHKMDTNSRFYSICEYRLTEDHWVPHTRSEDIKRVSEAIFNFTKTNDAQTISIRDDFLLFDFISFLNLHLNIVGLIGQCDDVFKQMRFNIQLGPSHNENYPGGYSPKNKLHPELVLYLSDEQIYTQNKTRLAYLFLFIPFLNPASDHPQPASPMSPTYEEATIDAYMRMKTCCSQVVLIGKNELNEPLSEYDLKKKNFDYYINDFNFVFGRKNKIIQENNINTNTQNFDSFFFGSIDTSNYCEIISESTEKNDQNEIEEEIKFDSLQHFIKWIEWKSRFLNISFILDDFNSDVDFGELNELKFLYENSEKSRFRVRTEKTRISCEISGEIFGLVHQHMIKNIRFFDSTKEQAIKHKGKLIINEIVAYEDGQLQVRMKYKYENEEEERKKNTYEFFKIEQSLSKVAIPGYFNKIAILKKIDHEIELLNSWFINDNNILLTLFYSKLEKKVLVIVIPRYFDDQTLPPPIFEIESDFEYQYNSMSRTSEYYSSFSAKSGVLLFTIVEDFHSKIVSIIIKKDFTGIDNVNKKEIDDFIKFEAEDNEFENRQKEKLSNTDLPLLCFPLEDTEIRFTGFSINESGNEGIMGFVHLDNELIKGCFHYLIYFNPIELTLNQTIKFDYKYFDKIIIKKDDDEDSSSNFDAVHHSISFPILYIDNKILLLLYYNKLPPNEKYQGLTYMVINNIKDLNNHSSNNNHSIENYFLTSKELIEFEEPSNLFKVIKQFHHHGIIKTLNTLELVKIAHKTISPVEFDHHFSNLTSNYKYSDESHPGNIYELYQFPDFIESLVSFDLKSLSKLVLQTDEQYGNCIISQYTIPEPNKIPLQLSLVNVTLSEGSISIDKAKPFIEGLENLEFLHMIALSDDLNKTKKNYLHKSALRFIISLFTSVQIVVSKPIVDSTTMYYYYYNAKMIEKEENKLKNCMQHFYTIRSRSFPTFPFLRMTSKSRIFHIGVIGDNKSGGSSLLSWITGCAFSNMPNNTLTIGSNCFPTFRYKSDLFENNFSIKKDSIKNIINVVGSLFTVQQGTFAQVVGFISALIACDTIILEFTELQNILKFFRMFFDCADLICSEFNIIFQKNINVAIFCNADSDLQVVKNEVYSLIEERSLNSSSSLAVQAIEKINFKFITQSSSTYQKAIRIRNIGFINVLESTRKTSELMAPLQKMSLIFGQQIDHEANRAALWSLLNEKEKHYTPFVEKDYDIYDFSNQILKKSLKESDRKEAQNLIEQSAKLGNIKANVKLLYDEDIIEDKIKYKMEEVKLKAEAEIEEINEFKKQKQIKKLQSDEKLAILQAEIKIVFEFLDNAINEGSEEAIEEKCRILTKWKYSKKARIRYLNPITALEGLQKYHQRYLKGEHEQTSNQIINLINYIYYVDDEKTIINTEIIYTGVEILINKKEDIYTIHKLFEHIPENQRTNHSINFRLIDYMKVVLEDRY